MNDIAATFNTAQPTAYGGTGGTSITSGYDGLNARGANVATASSINLSTVTGPNLHLTGTTTVATVTLPEGNVRQVIADAAFQLTASANLIVNGSTSVNYTTTARTNLLFIGDAGGVVYVWALGGAFLPLSGGTLTTASAGTLLGLTSTDAGAASGPNIEQYRNSASPAINDILGRRFVYGQNTTPAKVEYASDIITIASPTAAAESAVWDFRVNAVGTPTVFLRLAALADGTFDSSKIGLPLGQINFPVTANPSGNAYTLDDYRELDWTPIMTFNGSSAGVTYSTQTARAVKIGKTVFCTANITMTNNGSGSGTARLTNFPFTCNDRATTGVLTMIAGGSAATGLKFLLQPSSTEAVFYIPGATADVVATDTNLTNTFAMVAAITYEAAS